jgi:hypothetical protein
MALFLAVGVAGCAVSKSNAASGSDATIRLAATLISPTGIELKWRDSDANAAGHIVEYATDPNGQYIILSFLPPNQTTFTHSNLMPGTKFYYRIRAFYGPASVPIEISLPDELSETNYVARYAGETDYSWTIPETVATEIKVAKKPIRIAVAAAAAAPTDLRAKPMPATVSGFKFIWTDHASDEDGYLLELKPERSADFQVCALLASNINSLGYVFAPPARKASFRVRAFYYGTPSNVAQQTTGSAAAHSIQNMY